MYTRIAILRKKEDTINGGAETVTIGFFDSRGTLQLEVPQVSGKLFPNDIATGKSVIFTYPAKITEIKK